MTEQPGTGQADKRDSQDRSDVERALREELQAVERRAAFLSEASSILAASSLSVESTIRTVARLAASRLADWCAVYVTDTAGRVRHATIAHRDPRREAMLRQFDGTPAEPVKIGRASCRETVRAGVGAAPARRPP